jgi:excisionase family DNA binding protein
MGPFSKLDYMTPKEAADMIGVTVNTIRRWVQNGRLVAWQPAGKRGWISIRRDSLPGKDDDYDDRS